MTRQKYSDDDKKLAADLKKKKASVRRALKRKIAKAEKVRAGTETYTEEKARKVKEARAKINETVRNETAKAIMLGSDHITAASILGQPENKRISKIGKLSLAAIERIAQLGFDPLEQSVKIAQGKLLKEDHPFLSEFKMLVEEMTDTLESFEPIEFEDLERFRKVGIKALSNSLTPADLRSKHTLELIQYIYPKRKSIEMAVQTDRPDMAVTTLTPDEVKLFESKFRDRY